MEKNIKQQQEYEIEVQFMLKSHRKKVIIIKYPYDNILQLYIDQVAYTICTFTIVNIIKNYIKLHFQLLEDLALQQIQLEHELEKVQQERDTNRARLLSYIYNGTIISDYFQRTLQDSKYAIY